MKRAILLICLLVIYGSIFFVLGPIARQVFEKYAGLPLWMVVLVFAMVVVFAISFLARSYFTLISKEDDIKPHSIWTGIVLAGVMLGVSAYVSEQR